MKTLKASIPLVVVLVGMAIWIGVGNSPANQANRVSIEPQKVSKAGVLAGQDTLEWNRPRFDERRDERHELVEQGIVGQGITDQKVIEAMKHVPRHLFVPPSYRQYAYQNRPLPIGHDQTISQPYVVGYMTSLLDLQAGEKVLEIGTGSGYQAAVLSEITPEVYTIEIVEPLGQQARKLFDQLGYNTIQTKIGDGYKGWPEHAPFDAIIVTAAASEIPQPLINQLSPGGTMVIPVGEEGETQTLATVTKSADGEVSIDRKLTVRFVPMTGKIQEIDG